MEIIYAISIVYLSIGASLALLAILPYLVEDGNYNKLSQSLSNADNKKNLFDESSEEFEDTLSQAQKWVESNNTFVVSIGLFIVITTMWGYMIYHLRK